MAEWTDSLSLSPSVCLVSRSVSHLRLLLHSRLAERRPERRALELPVHRRAGGGVAGRVRGGPHLLVVLHRLLLAHHPPLHALLLHALLLVLLLLILLLLVLLLLVVLLDILLLVQLLLLLLLLQVRSCNERDDRTTLDTLHSRMSVFFNFI